MGEEDERREEEERWRGRGKGRRKRRRKKKKGSTHNICANHLYSTYYVLSLLPRPRGRREDGLVSTACTCASIPRKAWEFVFVCKWSVKLIRSYTSDSLPYHRKETSEKALSVRVRCLETCHAVRNLLHKCPEFRFDCLDFAYAGTAGKPSPLSTDTTDMRSNLHRRERQSSHNPTSPKRAAEYLGRPSERRICFAATFWLGRVRRLDLEYWVRI